MATEPRNAGLQGGIALVACQLLVTYPQLKEGYHLFSGIFLETSL